MKLKIVTLDVRDVIRQGGDPFARIMAAIAQLPANAQLRLLAPFEPVPLCAVLRNQGFTYIAKEIAGEDWEVLFTREPEKKAAPEKSGRPAGAPTKSRPIEIVKVDARGLEPPQPMVKILEALAGLPAGAELHAHTERKPMHLYGQLEERGFIGETKEQSDGSHITKIHRS